MEIGKIQTALTLDDAAYVAGMQKLIELQNAGVNRGNPLWTELANQDASDDGEEERPEAEG